MSRKRKRAASSGARSLSRPLRDQSGIGSPEKKKAEKLSKVVERGLNRMGKAEEADRKISTKMPKHMFAGKRKMNKVSRRLPWSQRFFLIFLRKRDQEQAAKRRQRVAKATRRERKTSGYLGLESHFHADDRVRI
ncbi:unnamed protein product [Porites lobata]|uniref:Uncharacterized protein n=1 Tax=Porites lobata TaxID=104759 RepID=A0ABN8R9U3_9CNID|nr:unnamed protein product [Porites lobata]